MLYGNVPKISRAQNKERTHLNKFRTILIVLGILVVAGGAGLIFLSFWDPPTPTGAVEKELPNDAFQK
jgi:hypothetical protein